MNVLVTSASRKVSLVRAFQAGLQRTGGGTVIAADVDPRSAALYVADAAEIVPRSDDPAFLDAIAAVCARHAISLIVPTRDEELHVFAVARPRFEQAGIVVAVPDSDVVETCQDKIAFHDFCMSHGLPVPRRFDIRAPEFPAFVKPRRGKGGEGTGVVRNAAELDARYAQASGDVIIQELIDAPEYTVDLLADLDGDVVSVVPRERVRIVAGESYVSRIDMRVDMIGEVRRLAAATRFRGHTTIQCFVTSRGVEFIEVNPRFGGAAALGWAAGAPTPEYLVRLARGEMVRHDPASVRDGLLMLRFTEDLYLMPGQLIVGSDR